MTMPFYKSKYLVPAVFLMLLTVTFSFGPNGVSWFWADQPIVAVVLLATSLVFWALLVVNQRSASQSG